MNPEMAKELYKKLHAMPWMHCLWEMPGFEWRLTYPQEGWGEAFLESTTAARQLGIPMYSPGYHDSKEFAAKTAEWAASCWISHASENRKTQRSFEEKEGHLWSGEVKAPDEISEAYLKWAREGRFTPKSPTLRAQLAEKDLKTTNQKAEEIDLTHTTVNRASYRRSVALARAFGLRWGWDVPVEIPSTYSGVVRRHGARDFLEDLRGKFATRLCNVPKEFRSTKPADLAPPSWFYSAPGSQVEWVVGTTMDTWKIFHPTTGEAVITGSTFASIIPASQAGTDEYVVTDGAGTSELREASKMLTALGRRDAMVGLYRACSEDQLRNWSEWYGTISGTPSTLRAELRRREVVRKSDEDSAPSHPSDEFL